MPRAISGRKNNRNAAFMQRIHKLRNVFARHVDIQNGGVDVMA
jgi:hypothetical protein